MNYINNCLTKKNEIMKTIKVYLLPMMLTLAMCLASCSNDYEIWDDVNETETWEYELRNIMSDLDFLFENSFVKFQQAEELNYKVDSLDFFSDDTYYPVCIKKLYNFFMLKKLDFVANDSNTIHMPSFAIKGIVSNIVNNQEKYNIVKLTWSYGDEKFTTLAVFDKTNGQLIYDNILTNIPLSQTEIPSRKSKLTRSEPGSGNGNVETKIFYKGTLPLDHGFDHYLLRVKCLCEIHYNGPIGCSDFYVTYKSIHKKLDEPSNPYHNVSVRYDACVSLGRIIGYIWTGTCSFPYSGSAETICDHILDNYLNGYSTEDQWYSAGYDYLDTELNAGHYEADPTTGDWSFH